METYNGAGIALFKKTSEGFSILLGKRQNRPGIGKWSIFGGKREKYDIPGTGSRCIRTAEHTTG